MTGKSRFFFAAAIFAASLISCVREKGEFPPQRIGAWVVYWDGARGLSELAAYGGSFDRVSLFAYELDEHLVPRHAPHFDELMPRFFSLASECGFSPWVTVVNDIRVPDGVILKGTDMLRRAMSDPESLKKHARRIAEMAKEDGFAGVDLDYEGFKPSDQAGYNALLKELALEFRRHGLGLNIVVGPKKGPLPPPGSLPLTVMGYNLHGPHSGPGPRSTPAFITSLGERCGRSSDAAELAIAVGGFSWDPDGKVKQMDWSAVKEVSLNAAKRGRGIIDGVPFAYLGDGTRLWFEDAESIQAKWDAAYKAGCRSLMIWHLGGNDDTLFQVLRAYRNKLKERGR